MENPATWTPLMRALADAMDEVRNDEKVTACLKVLKEHGCSADRSQVKAVIDAHRADMRCGRVGGSLVAKIANAFPVKEIDPRVRIPLLPPHLGMVAFTTSNGIRITRETSGPFYGYMMFAKRNVGQALRAGFIDGLNTIEPCLQMTAAEAETIPDYVPEGHVADDTPPEYSVLADLKSSSWRFRNVENFKGPQPFPPRIIERGVGGIPNLDQALSTCERYLRLIESATAPIGMGGHANACRLAREALKLIARLRETQSTAQDEPSATPASQAKWSDPPKLSGSINETLDRYSGATDVDALRKSFEERAFSQYFLSRIRKVDDPSQFPFEIASPFVNKEEFVRRDAEGKYVEEGLEPAWWAWQACHRYYLIGM